MAKALRVLAFVAALLPVASASALESATGKGDLAGMEALRSGTLSFWVSARVPSDPRWAALAGELEKAYPQLQVEWKALKRDDFTPALDAALKANQAPDVVFVDNYAQEGPLVDGHGGRRMAGHPRHGEAGWWTILNGAPDKEVAEAFLLWLEQPAGVMPPQPLTQLLSADDKLQITSIAGAVIEASGALAERVFQDVMDSAAAPFAQNQVSTLVSSPKSNRTCLAGLEQIGGNSRLAFVAGTALEQGEESYGLLHSFLVFRKQGSAWKVLLFEPANSWPATQQLVAKFDSLGLLNQEPQGAETIALLAPGDGEKTARFPRAELAFQQTGGDGGATAIESQAFDPGRKVWYPAHLDWVREDRDPAAVTRMTVPFGVGMQPHRWRVLSISKEGAVMLSEWRTLDFTN